MYLRRLYFVVFAASSVVGACAPVDHANGDVDAYRAAVPSAAQVKLAPPASGAASLTQSGSPGVGVQGLDGAPSRATYYLFTREIFDGANAGTGWVLGVVWSIAQLPPTSVDGHVATWGPGSEDLSPAEWRLEVTEREPGVYDYVFAGREKSVPHASWSTTLRCTGYGRDHASYGKGNFTIDYDVANRLDPARVGASSQDGKVDVTYSLASVPTSVRVVAHASRDESWFDVTVSQASEGGRVDLTALSDINSPHDGVFEKVTLQSRWLASGSGRADVTLSGGDVPSGLGTVRSSECWSSSFLETYYSDSAGLAPTRGAAAGCPFASAD